MKPLWRLNAILVLIEEGILCITLHHHFSLSSLAHTCTHSTLHSRDALAKAATNKQTTRGWWMGLGMRGRIEAIDPRPTVSPALLASVKALLEGDGFCLLKYWINGAEVTAGPRTVSSPLGCVCACVCVVWENLSGCVCLGVGVSVLEGYWQSFRMM